MAGDPEEEMVRAYIRQQIARAAMQGNKLAPSDVVKKIEDEVFQLWLDLTKPPIESLMGGGVIWRRTQC